MRTDNKPVAAQGGDASIVPVLQRFRRAGYVLAGLGGALSIAAFIVGRQQFFQAYLFAYVFWVSVTLGCFALTLLHHVVRGSWGLPILRILEAGTRTFPLMAGLFLVVVWGMALGDIYPWASREPIQDPLMRHGVESKAPYLNPFWFVIRAMIYFAIWTGLSMFLNRSSLEQDRTNDTRLAQTRTNWSAPGLVVFVLTITFAFTDWVMSLDPRWYSTILGIYFLVGQALFALALATFVVTTLSNRRPFSEVVTPQVMRDLGNLLLAITMFWQYISLSQFLIMWYGNLPEEITYYTTRTSGGWLPVGTLIIVFHFFVPFLMLLSGRTKRTPRLLASVAALILVMRLVDMAWTVLPFYQQVGQPVGPNLAWMSVATLMGLGGIWLGAWAFQLRKNPLLPRHDARLREVLEHA